MDAGRRARNELKFGAWDEVPDGGRRYWFEVKACGDQRYQLFERQAKSRHHHRGPSTSDPAMVEEPELVSAVRLSDRSGRGR